jgi:ABC-type amino acid transport substrate-binding protein
MPEDTPPYAWKVKNDARGFDVQLARAVANRLDRDLVLFWYENEYDRESDGVIGVNALLSANLCDIVAGYTLYAPTLGKPAAPFARTPGYRGAKPPRQRPWISLGTLVPSRPYHSAAMAIILGPGAGERTVETLADLEGLRLGTVAGSMGGTILRTWQDGKYLKQTVSLQSNVDPLDGLARGQFDATLTDVHSLDTWRLAHPEGKLRLSTYRHPARFNMGYVTLAERQSLLDQVNQALITLTDSGDLERMAAATAMTWLAPVEPAIQPELSLPSIVKMSNP